MAGTARDIHEACRGGDTEEVERLTYPAIEQSEIF